MTSCGFHSNIGFCGILTVCPIPSFANVVPYALAVSVLGLQHNIPEMTPKHSDNTRNPYITAVFSLYLSGISSSGALFSIAVGIFPSCFVTSIAFSASILYAGRFVSLCPISF